MARRNVEGADNEMLKASRGRVWGHPSRPIRVFGSIVSSSSGVRGGALAENYFSIYHGYLWAPDCSIWYNFWLRSERCLCKHPYRWCKPKHYQESGEGKHPLNGIQIKHCIFLYLTSGYSFNYTEHSYCLCSSTITDTPIFHGRVTSP